MINKTIVARLEHQITHLEDLQQDYEQWRHCLRSLDSIEYNLPARFYLEKLKISNEKRRIDGLQELAHMSIAQKNLCNK